MERMGSIRLVRESTDNLNGLRAGKRGDLSQLRVNQPRIRMNKSLSSTNIPNRHRDMNRSTQPGQVNDEYNSFKI